MKEDGCGKTENKGERIDEEDGIFSFEGEDKGERVWIVLVVNYICSVLDIHPFQVLFRYSRA
jgi:hypothetical protein